MSANDICLIIFGAVLGFLLSLLGEYTRRVWERNKRREYAKGFLSAILVEVEEGVSRCEWLVKKRKDHGESYSRIYVALWESSRNELVEYIEDLNAREVLRLLHKIYYCFDLINFNMQREKFGVGGAFAEDKLSEITSSLSKLKTKLSELGIPGSDVSGAFLQTAVGRDSVADAEQT
jgi:hypothetical protein